MGMGSQLAVLSLVVALVSTSSLIQNIDEIKDLQKLLRTRTNVLLVVSSSAKAVPQKLRDNLEKVAKTMKGVADIAAVDCQAAKKVCKKFKFSPSQYSLKHFSNGEFSKDYDRAEQAKSIVGFLRDPTGDVPWSEEQVAADVVHIDETKQFARVLEKNQRVFAMFYVPWCGYCKRMKPEFAAAATASRKKVAFVGADVQKPENFGLQQLYNVTGYPTIFLFKKGQIEMKYSGGPTKEDILKWLENPVAEPAPSTPEKDATPWSEEAPEVAHLTDSSFAPTLAKTEHALVMFYAPWCGHCKKMKPEYQQAAAKLPAGGNAILAAVDATEEKQVSGQYEVKGYPTTKYFNFGVFKYDVQARTEADLLAFLADPKEPVPPPPEVSWEDEAPEVKHLTDDSFSDLKKYKHALVMFYAPWCGHCKAAKPEFAEAARELADNERVALAAVDCTKYNPTCQIFGVQGFPTLKYLSYGKNAEEYSRGRSKGDFVRFFEEKVSAKTEL